MEEGGGKAQLKPSQLVAPAYSSTAASRKLVNPKKMDIPPSMLMAEPTVMEKIRDEGSGALTWWM